MFLELSWLFFLFFAFSFRDPRVGYGPYIMFMCSSNASSSTSPPGFMRLRSQGAPAHAHG